MRDTETKPRRMGLKMKILLILLTLLLASGAAALFPVREEGEDHE